MSRSPRRKPRSGRASGASGSGHPFLWGLMAGVVLVVTAGYFLLPPPPPPGITPARASLPFGGRPEPTPADPPAAAPAVEAPRYDFYTILRDMEVKVPDWQLEAEQSVEEKPGEVAEPGVYVIQVGAFRSPEDAQRAKADLALKGIRAGIQEVTINGNEHWFRVRVGPFEDVEALRTARTALLEQGVGFIVVKDRKG